MVVPSPGCSRHGIGIFGDNTTIVWGFSDRQLRLVARHRPCRHVDLGAAAADAAEMARLAQPLRRGDDAVRRLDGRAVPDLPSRPALCLYWSALPQYQELWPQWRSALVWDFWAVGPTSFSRAVLVCRADPRPRHAARSRHERARAPIYGAFALGWRGSARHWEIHERFYRYMAALAVPLVVSVHSIVEPRFRGEPRTGLGGHDLSALFRRGRALFGLRHGGRASRRCCAGPAASSRSSPFGISR